MALAFRTLTAQGNASGSALTVTKPTGTIDGDILIVISYLETDTNSWSTGPVGSGFTLLRSDTAAAKFRQDTYWKRASSEPASWSWTPTSSAWRTLTMAAYSGNTGTGTPVDVHGGNSSASLTVSTSQTAPSVTTTTTNDMLTFLYSNFSGVNVAALTGAANTFRNAFGGQILGDNIRASAGATGTTNPTSMGDTEFAAAHLALLLASSGAGATILLLNQMPNTLVRM